VVLLGRSTTSIDHGSQSVHAALDEPQTPFATLTNIFVNAELQTDGRRRSDR
jgi:hypothetical protein